MKKSLTLNLTNKFTAIRKAFNDPAKYVMISAGRRGGKTYEAAMWLIKELLSTDAVSALWVDTKQANIDKYVERYFKKILKPIWHLCSYNQQKKILTLPGSKYIDFGSAERPENLEGFEYDRVVINEAGITLRKATLWDNTLQPMTKGNRNKTRFVGTPKGKNKFHTLFQFGVIKEEGYASFKFSAYASPYWDKDELDRIKRIVPERVWLQEYMAEFVEGEGSVFRGISRCIRPESNVHPKPGVQYIMSADLAKHEDFTVIMVAELESKAIVHIDRFNEVNWTLQKGRIFSTWERFNRAKAVIDSTGVGDSIFDDLRAAGMTVEGYKFTNSSKTQLIENLSVAIENQEIFYPNNDTLIAELELYEYNVTQSGNVTYGAPDGFHDDTVIALGLINHLLKNNVTVRLNFV